MIAVSTSDLRLISVVKAKSVTPSVNDTKPICPDTEGFEIKCTSGCNLNKGSSGLLSDFGCECLVYLASMHLSQGLVALACKTSAGSGPHAEKKTFTSQFSQRRIVRGPMTYQVATSYAVVFVQRQCFFNRNIPKYRIDHPENSFFPFSNRKFSGSKYPKNIVFIFQSAALYSTRDRQCFCFQIQVKNSLDTLIQTGFLQIMKINNFRGCLANVSAKKEPMVPGTALQRFCFQL